MRDFRDAVSTAQNSRVITEMWMTNYLQVVEANRGNVSEIAWRDQ
jgi:hypothetical protein